VDKNFFLEQGFNVKDNVIYQDNQSAMLLEQHGHASSRQRTRHINIRYFFITDRVKAGEMSIKYCPTADMLADFFTKPLQGTKFRQMRDIIMNLGNSIEQQNHRSVLERPMLEPLVMSHGRTWSERTWFVHCPMLSNVLISCVNNNIERLI